MPTIQRLLTDDTGQALVTAINNVVAAVKPNATEIQMSSSDTTTVATEITNINDKIGTVPSGQTVEGQITTLNSKLKTVIDYSSGVELISGATATSITAKRIGYAVVVNVSGLRLPTTESVWTTIFTLPEGCRPPFQIYQTLLFDTLPDSAHHHATEISVNANGTVNMYAPVADATYWGSLVFPISY